MKIRKNVLSAIISHSERELPYESCGYLAQKDGEVLLHYELTNTDKAADHFTMDPKEQFAAIKDMREKSLKLYAVYHSHPETPARPSEEDIRLAFDPHVSYVIISLFGGENVVKSFRIVKGEVSEEVLEVVDDTESE